MTINHPAKTVLYDEMQSLFHTWGYYNLIQALISIVEKDRNISREEREGNEITQYDKDLFRLLEALMQARNISELC